MTMQIGLLATIAILFAASSGFLMWSNLQWERKHDEQGDRLYEMNEEVKRLRHVIRNIHTVAGEEDIDA